MTSQGLKSATIDASGRRVAQITQRAIAAFHLQSLSGEAIEAAMVDDEVSEDDLNECDDSYYKSGEDVAGQLFAFIKKNKDAIRL